MSKSSYALAASNIKKELSAAFPGIKFSVKSKSYSMGCSVTVSWELGPTSKEVDALIDKYQYGDFDGMTDSFNYRQSGEEFRATHGSAKYVHGSRSMPEGMFSRICRDIAALQGVEFVSEWQRKDGESLGLGDYAHRTFARTSFPAGAEYVGVNWGFELALTGACMSGDSYRIVHSKTDEDAEMREVVKREFDYIRSREVDQTRLRLVG